jgi:hypothetical protein
MDSNGVKTATVCRCTDPVPEVKAPRKGVARTYCRRCGLPARIAFEVR